MTCACGVKFDTGRTVDARRYVESDGFGAYDYYLGEGSGVADRNVVVDGAVERAASMMPGQMLTRTPVSYMQNQVLRP